MSAREPRRGRRSSSLNPRLRLLVVCGGELTEPAYFKGLKAYLRNPSVNVRVVPKGRAPLGVVKYADEIASNSGGDFDEVWCVVDSDEFILGPAKVLADKRGMELAVSNPCFELWLLLHHLDQKAPLCNAKAVRYLLFKHVPDRGKEVLFSDFESGLENALQRAKLLDPSGCNHKVDPSSGVWKLVELMKNGAQLS